MNSIVKLKFHSLNSCQKYRSYRQKTGSKDISKHTKRTDMDHNASCNQRICPISVQTHRGLNMWIADIACCPEKKIRKSLTSGNSAKVAEFPVSYAQPPKRVPANQWYHWKVSTPKVCLLAVSIYQISTIPNGEHRTRKKIGLWRLNSSTLSDV